MKRFRYFREKVIFCFSLIVFCFFAQSIEINADTFVKTEKEDEEESFELSAPNMGRVYTNKKVIIKRDLSALDSAMESANEDSKKHPHTLIKEQKPSSQKKSNRLPASADYQDLEIYWNR